MENVDDNYFKNYQNLLERLYKKVPAPASSGERFEPPKLIAHQMGNQTVIRNFREVADKLRREPELLARYFLKGLATSGNYDRESGTLLLNSKLNVETLNNILNKFIESYVICPTCGRPDTVIIKKGKIWILKCEACGAEGPVKPF
ncbi:translation initiation factor IF-2 subunit beta [Fervidicoccus fontis]|jgi:translation initiation factor 2 subunit 2|uniref:Translation initiation factor 2 subunit beta n=2 Tax=Fervidicoccus fontis TaxID=683846 RepID=I0A1F4_FERFK|nr:translation initiation factor IF-2 subunit beta [Fervidicoccus fontis]AFH42811.1 translation initiation factor IF-2 subunit beta [Fervidicoccus fontis Kam940]MBE9391597.1 translation initiation factor IF-2 subunit beta [Fervidicoccus fontis]PMB76302.1 MAG: translation initiation factor IF-2 subunit beta [Fervidicoccus fontis]HEW63781.1 translation initiation factor IF-2 subunit beta [Fervidicoccus fontis]